MQRDKLFIQITIFLILIPPRKEKMNSGQKVKIMLYYVRMRKRITFFKGETKWVIMKKQKAY